jgi:hypothetical protein
MPEIEMKYSRIYDLDEQEDFEDDDYILIDSEENGVRKITYENFMKGVIIHE